MAYTYYYDNDGVCESRSVTGSTTGCVFYSRNEYGWSPICGANEYTEVWKQTLTFAIESPAPVDIRVYYSYTLRYDDQCTSNPDPRNRPGRLRPPPPPPPNGPRAVLRYGRGRRDRPALLGRRGGVGCGFIIPYNKPRPRLSRGTPQVFDSGGNGTALAAIQDD